MKVIREGHLYQLITMPNVFPVNCYIVEEEDGLTLIDAALSFSFKGIQQTVKPIGKPITRILLTHAHGDHVGALDRIKQAYPEASVMISERDAKLFRGDTSLEPGEPNTPIKGGVPASLKTKIDIMLKAGDQIGSLRAIATPGHTPGHMAFLDIRNQTCIAGDAIQTRGGIAVAGKVQPRFPFPAFGTWNKHLALESAKQLRELAPRILAVGHGKLLKDPVRELDKAIIEATRAFSK